MRENLNYGLVGEVKSAPYRRGFTLVELLVVMTIISILAGMLLPVLGRARSLAHATACASQLRQIGFGYQGYRDNWGGFVPYSYLYFNLGASSFSLIGADLTFCDMQGLSYPCTKTESIALSNAECRSRVLMCPANKQAWHPKATYPTKGNYMYGMGNPDPASTSPWVDDKYSRFNRAFNHGRIPKDYVLYMDAPIELSNTASGHTSYPWNWNSSAFYDISTPNYHLGKANILYPGFNVGSAYRNEIDPDKQLKVIGNTAFD